jgi:ribosomal-protein-serine acetyltransferase
MFSLIADDEVALELAEEHHAAELFALTDRNREHLRPWMPWVDGTVTAADSLAFLRFIRGEYAAGRAFHCNLRYRGALVGGMGLNRIQRDHDKADLGYWIDAGHVGRGIVTRAARALTEAAHSELGLHRVAIRAAVDNTRSRAVAERLGYAYEGVLLANEKVGDRYLDHASYVAVAGQWPDAGTLPGNDAARA